AFSSGAGRTSDRNRSHWSTSKTPSYTKSVSWQHHPSMESNTWNTIHDNKKENAALNDVQVEVNYAIKLDDQWTVRPGMLTHFSSNGTRYGPYVKLSWDATKDLNFGIRYRYDWKAYRQQDLSGDMSRDNVHRWDGYVTYHINSDFTFAWQTTLYSKQNDYRYANHKKWATENAFVLQYHMTPDITPYIEYDYLDRQGVYNGRDNLSENSYRIGVSFKL
ncbi:oligogalacturonate-specific porin KdgM family protein, partial [Escherichia coli]|nr:oligogalacturonate-specific porin KdgM family protein [Escherichia coli]